ncbi:phosphoribosylformimino-5-aminoimidazole carboxamide ribotide isomerase [Clostridium sp. C105KSO13]|uniref:phosphoribosylformimino-5-aminoimidazole carboxamide ribotide isomerase n=1 Tax=Clostridium sp. C105KSO13 TaxID=1776045 RepID=UPI0007407EF9|nr:phosphoribosylformimino-5-aminoimidazole carboxamide ribotide isomerase [Clostridium sp. C105KSO13]CUX28926.1 1-(5-phosphoribosyl)-5-[(5-phosphoribosylamino)methylideneamino] imidazole-4-carboxamide isomerase [Clostridium sp. C105KSO13]
MRFRPCIDIHNGQVKQIVGGSLKDEGNQAVTNFSSQLDAAWYANLYRRENLAGGHIILLNSRESEYFEATQNQALNALAAYPGGMQIGGGITVENAAGYLQAGASHVIVTSYVFRGGMFCREKLEELVKAVGRKHVVLDLSCRRREGYYYIVTDRWQNFTNLCLTRELLSDLSGYCDEFLVHGVDVEGRSSGVETGLVRMLGQWDQIPITYAGGIGSLEDLERFRKMSGGNLDFTIGSALDLFGGNIPYEFIAKL